MVQMIQVRDVSVWLGDGLLGGVLIGEKGRRKGALFEKLDVSVWKRMIRRAQLATNPLFDC